MCIRTTMQGIYSVYTTHEPLKHVWGTCRSFCSACTSSATALHSVPETALKISNMSFDKQRKYSVGCKVCGEGPCPLCWWNDCDQDSAIPAHGASQASLACLIRTTKMIRSLFRSAWLRMQRRICAGEVAVSSPAVQMR